MTPYKRLYNKFQFIPLNKSTAQINKYQKRDELYLFSCIFPPEAWASSMLVFYPSTSVFSKMPLLRVPNWMDCRSIFLADIKDKNSPNFYILTGVIGARGLEMGQVFFASISPLWGVKKRSSTDITSSLIWWLKEIELSSRSSSEEQCLISVVNWST